jgi:hypothetical protein
MLEIFQLFGRKGWLLISCVLLAMSLQACDLKVHVYREKTVGDPKATEGGPRDDCDGAKGCDPMAWGGQSAQGFVGVGGPTPVAAGHTCAANTNKCQSYAEGVGPCSLRYPAKKCRSVFYYPASGTVGNCSCDCVQ